MTRFLTWLTAKLLGPKCRWCAYRGRGPRSLDRHERAYHPLMRDMYEAAEIVASHKATCRCHPAYHELGVHGPRSQS